MPKAGEYTFLNPVKSRGGVLPKGGGTPNPVCVMESKNA